MTVFDIRVNFIYLIILSIFQLSFSTLASNELEIEIDNPKFTEKGLDNKIYEIKALKGLKSDNELKLFSIEGKFKTDDGTWIYLTADQGNYFQDAKIITLERNVVFYTDNNEILKSDFARFDVGEDVFDFTENVKHKNSEGIVMSDSSRVISNFKNIVYEGNVSAKFYEVSQ